jgi:hypothetical protein
MGTLPTSEPTDDPTEIARRMAAARNRLTELLRPETDEEHVVVRRLVGGLDLPFLTVLIELIEYRRDRQG